MIDVTEHEIDLTEVVDSVRSPDADTLVVFVGTMARDEGTKRMELEAFPEVARQNMARLREEAIARFGVVEASMVHRVGGMGIGEDLVVVAVSGRHRAETFHACRFLIDALRVTVPIWRKGHGPGTWATSESVHETWTLTDRGMVDVSGKEVVPRSATAEGFLVLSPQSIEAIRSRRVRKGDAIEVARVAAVWGVKHTPSMIPHCHPVPLTAVDVIIDVEDGGVRVSCAVKADHRTGVEMEALTGVNAALLTIWDMVKDMERDQADQYPATRIRDLRVLKKLKGDGE